ncbi:hypothetical protein BHE74_00057483 [Ensete ventricosum]|nr:hypothetical protein BHE74_00057483 [Ensete ventricosum]RZS10955.1 hypothetical protein BHM03_00042234 [Ensete ventricosum]
MCYPSPESSDVYYRGGCASPPLIMRQKVSTCEAFVKRSIQLFRPSIGDTPTPKPPPSPMHPGRSIPHYCCPKLVLVNRGGVDRLSSPLPSPETHDRLCCAHRLTCNSTTTARRSPWNSSPSLFCSVSLATMVVLSNPGLDQISLLRSPKAIACSPGVPVIDLSKPDAAASLVEACEEFGFLKVTDHGIPVELMQRLEAEAVRFFSLSPVEKERSGPPDPFGYGNRKIGANGDIGWLEYLLFAVASKPLSYTFMDFLREPAACSFR